MIRSIELRLRKLERKAERPLSDLSTEELEARLQEVETALIESYGSVHAVAAALRQQSPQGALQFLNRQQRKANAAASH
jgi:hypothetical protein